MKQQSQPDGGSGTTLKKEFIEWIKIIVAACAIALFLNTCIIANSNIPSTSMENTVMAGDRILGSRLAYRMGNQPQRGDIVIFFHKTEPGKDKTRLVKRVIGLPGETVTIRSNQIYINQSETPLNEPYLAEPMVTSDRSFEVPDGCYLMFGDNRNLSLDARSWSDPYVPEDAILAKVMFRYYPWPKTIK